MNKVSVQGFPIYIPEDPAISVLLYPVLLVIRGLSLNDEQSNTRERSFFSSSSWSGQCFFVVSCTFWSNMTKKM